MHFKFDALLDIAVKSSGGVRRSFSRAFAILLDNRAIVVARVPNPLAGPSRLTVSSEAATLKYGNYQPSICR